MKKCSLHRLYFVAVVAAVFFMAVSCGDGGRGGEALHSAALEAVAPQGREAAFNAARKAVVVGLSAYQSEKPKENRFDAELVKHSRLMALLMPYDTVKNHNPYEAHYDSMPPGGIKMRINWLGGSLGRVFNDSNKFHLEAAASVGVQPLQNLSQVWQQAARLERLQTCEAYYLDDMTFSMPYLVPKAHKLLTDIGMAFRDSLRSRGGGYYRVKVTSVLRTPAQIKRLRRRNRNAVDTSAHLYATTFDISYLKFICDTPSIPRTQEDLKNLLGEVVDDMRSRERCYVKYERKQACYHITAR